MLESLSSDSTAVPVVSGLVVAPALDPYQSGKIAAMTTSPLIQELLTGCQYLFPIVYSYVLVGFLHVYCL